MKLIKIRIYISLYYALGYDVPNRVWNEFESDNPDEDFIRNYFNEEVKDKLIIEMI